LYRNNQQDATV